MKRHIWSLTIALTGTLLGLATFMQPLLAQSSADLSRPVMGTLIDLGDRGPTPADAGIRAHSNVELFMPTGTCLLYTSWFVKSAAEVVMVDATTGALLNRLKRGNLSLIHI